MTLAAGDKRLALRTGVTADGMPVLVQLEGKCSPLTTGNRRVGLISGVTAAGLPVIAWSDQKCKSGETFFEAGKRYLGVISGRTDAGVPIIASWCEECGGVTFPACDCEICCTLDATVQLPSIADPAVWSTGIDVTLNCGETFTTWAGYISCLNNEVEDDTYVICYGETTYESRTADVVNFMGTDYTISSEIWKSEEFTYNSSDYRLVMIAASYSYMSGETLNEGCELYVILQKKVDTTVCGYQWCNISVTRATGGGLGGSGLTFPDLMIVTDPSFTSCAAGYSENGSGNCGSAGTMQSVSLDSEPDGQVDCPIVIAIEHIEPISTKVAKILITDNCEV